MASNPSIIKSVRLDLNLYKDLERITEIENRSMSNAIQWLLKNAVNEYKEKNIEDFCNGFKSE